MAAKKVRGFGQHKPFLKGESVDDTTKHDAAITVIETGMRKGASHGEMRTALEHLGLTGEEED